MRSFAAVFGTLFHNENDSKEVTTKSAKDAKIWSGYASSSFALFASFVVTLFLKDGIISLFVRLPDDLPVKDVCKASLSKPGSCWAEFRRGRVA